MDGRINVIGYREEGGGGVKDECEVSDLGS